jgi:transcription elongation GreA/GreB family factor
VGKALLGKRVGQTAQVKTPRGQSTYKVIGIER